MVLEGLLLILTISTNADIARSGRVRCLLLDDVSVYRVRGRDASVSVGFARASDDTRNPELPTVSLVAYKVDDKGHFEELVTDALVGSDDVYFGFVIKDPTLLSFDKLDPGTAEWRILRGDYEVYADAESSVAITPRLTIKLSGNDGATEYSDDKFDYPGFGSGESRTIVTKAEGRITVRKGDGTSILCGWDGTDAACLVYPPHRGLETVLVNTRCYLDRPGEDPASYGVFVGGRYLDGVTLQRAVVGYTDAVRDEGVLDGDLYQFATPDGQYVSAAARSNQPLGTLPFAAVDSTFSCEITGGEEDGYVVGFERAAVQVRPRPTVSIEDRGARRVVDDSDPFGEPVALIEHSGTEYTFGEGPDSDFKDIVTPGSGIPDADASFGDVAASLGKSLGVGFLTSFGSCVGSSLLSGGINALAERLGFAGASAVPTSNKNLDTKECSLDSAASSAVMEVITAVARDYIAWAHEGFEDKPLFYRNPTTFYKNFHDDVIGRAIDRSGLGFLCDIGVGNFEAYTATLKIDLQQRYYGLATERPRCTYNDLRNNLEDFYDDAETFLNDFDDAYLRKLGFTIDGTAVAQYGGTVAFPQPRSKAGNQLDELAATLDRTMDQAANSSNMLLSLSKMDAEVSEAEQEFEAAAKPPPQLFNPDDPTSVAAFRECTEAENPEGDADCFILNVSGSRITDAVVKGLDAPMERLLQIDEFGEIDQLVKMVVNATSAGLMRKHLKNGFGEVVGRETVELFSNIEDSIAASVTPSHTSRVNLSERWWSVFFDDNPFYNNLLNAELYRKDVSTLLRYIGSSFYEDPKRKEDKVPIPPVGPHTSFYTVVDGSNSQSQYPKPVYQVEHKDFSSSQFSRQYVSVYDSHDIAGAVEEHAIERLNGSDSWVKKNLAEVFDGWIRPCGDEAGGHPRTRGNNPDDAGGHPRTRGGGGR